jgi:alkylhydroperoxidase family enzyme
LAEEKVMAVMNFESSDLFDDRERAALRFAARFKSGDDGVDSDAAYEDIKRHFTEEEIIELALLCGETDGIGKFARSLQMRTWDEACEIQPKLRAGEEGVTAK